MIVDVWAALVTQGSPVTAGGHWEFCSQNPATLIANGVQALFNDGDILSFSDPDNTHLLSIDFCLVLPGVYCLEYVEGGDCEDRSTITLEVRDSPIVGVLDIPTLKLCQINGVIATITLTGFVHRSSDGTPFPDSLLGFDWHDGTSTVGTTRVLTFSPVGGASEITTTYTLTVTTIFGADECVDSHAVDVITGPNIYAGDPGAIGYVCEETGIFDLDSLVAGANGVLPIEPGVTWQWLRDGVEVIDGEVNVIGVIPGTYQYRLVVTYDNGTGDCTDSQTYDLVVVAQGNTGMDVMLDRCNEGSVILFDELNNGNPTEIDTDGTWVYFSGPGVVDGYAVSDPVPAPSVDFTGVTSGTYVFRYSAGNSEGTANCVATSDLIIEIDESPVVAILEADPIGICRIEGVTDPLIVTTELTELSDGDPFVGTVVYEWKIDNVVVGGNTSSISEDVSALVSGMHTVTVEVTGNCNTVMASIDFDISNDLVAGNNSNDDICN